MLTGVELTILILLGLDAVLSCIVIGFDICDYRYRKRIDERSRKND